MNFIEFIYKGVTYQAVGNSDKSCFICTFDENDETIMMGEFSNIDDMLDTPSIEKKTFREIMHSSELEYFCFF